MWRNFLSVWFFMQHERWAFIYIILFRAYSIFVHRNCGSVSKSGYVEIYTERFERFEFKTIANIDHLEQNYQ